LGWKQINNIFFKRRTKRTWNQSLRSRRPPPAPAAGRRKARRTARARNESSQRSSFKRLFSFDLDRCLRENAYMTVKANLFLKKQKIFYTFFYTFGHILHMRE